MRFRQLFKNIAIYGTGDILLKATAIITMPIYTRVFSRADYGVWSFLVTMVGLLNCVLVLGGDTAYNRFYFEVKTSEEKRVVASTWLGFLALWSLAIAVLLLPLSGWFSRLSFATNEWTILFALALFIAPVEMLNNMFGQVLLSEFRATAYTVLSLISAGLTVGFAVYAVLGLRLGLVGVFAGPLLAGLIILPVRVWTVRGLLGFRFSFSLLKRILAFGVPLVPTSLAYWVFALSDRFILAKLSTLDQLGLYSVANSVASVMLLMFFALGKAWAPFAVRMYEEDREKAEVFFGQFLTYILIGFGLLTVGITTFAREILVVLSTRAFYGAALAVGPLALGFIAYASSLVTSMGITVTKKTRYFSTISWQAALINVALNFIFVPRWGMMAAAWTTAIAYAYVAIAYLIVSQRLWPIVYEARKALTIVALSGAFILGVPWLPAPTPISGVLIKVAYVAWYVILLVLFRVIDEREWTAGWQVLRGFDKSVRRREKDLTEGPVG